eukprot:m.24862 g.24862  ORF g.24862 m.24862 type:complete len:320 (+) comp14775_c0_seq1:183-1142(+)
MSFPFQNVWNIIKHEAKADWDSEVEGSAKGKWYMELFGRHVRLSTYIFLAIAYHYTFDMEWAKELKLGWISFVFARNYFVMVVIYGGWHWFLYESMFRENIKHKKFNPKDPSQEQNRRDMFYTTLGFTQSSIWEVVLLHLWASNSTLLQPMYSNFWGFPMWSIFQVLFIAYWRDFHFYCIHRFMHPWKTEKIPDVGKFMYDNFHSLHHKSYNTAPWSGLAMHPVEHLVYYSCTLLPVIWSLHPFHFWMNKIHADISPCPGHDGYDKPAGGSYFHYIHHSKYEWNYGTPMVPMDKLFGSYADGSKWKSENIGGAKGKSKN